MTGPASRTSGATRSGGLSSVLPILRWVSSYRRQWFGADVVAGLTVAALVVPKSLGYAGIADVPLQYGLYAAAAGALLYAVFGTSGQVATGPSSALATVAAGAVIAAGASGDEDIIALVASITFVSGVLYLLLALFKMGWISQFLSKAVITGFLFGAAIQVVITELPKITGTKAEGDNSWQTLISWVQGLGDTDTTTLLVGGLSLVVIFALKIATPKLPGALVLLAGGLLASALLDLGGAGVAVVGTVPAGLPSVVLPDLDFLRENASVIVPASVGLLLIGFSQSAGDARTFASRHRYSVDINQESLAQGMSNVGSGLVQGIPVSTSLSASSLNDSSGAKTPLASMTTGVIVLLTLLFLAPVFSDLPEPVLAALIIQAVVSGMMDFPGMKRLYRVKRVDFWIAIAALVGVLSAGVLAGVEIGVVLSIGWLIYVSAKPPMPVLGREKDSKDFVPLDDFPAGQTWPGVVVLRFDAGLFFANSDALADRVQELALTGDPPLTTIVLDFEGINFIDSQGSATLSALVDRASEHDVSFRLARVKERELEVLRNDGIIRSIGEDNVYSNVDDAVMVGNPES